MGPQSHRTPARPGRATAQSSCSLKSHCAPFSLIPIITLPILSIPKHHHNINSHTPPLNPCFCVISIAPHRRIARKGKEAAATSTPSRSRTTKNSSRGRDDGFPSDRFESQIHYDQWKTMENRGYTHERIIRLLVGEPDFWHDRIKGLGWGFMYNAFIPINVTLVREFCANFSADHQNTVFLRGRRIPFTENDICRYLNIHIDLPGPGENDAFKEATEKRKGNDPDMELVFSVIGRQGTNWANNPMDDVIPERKLDNAISKCTGHSLAQIDHSECRPEATWHHIRFESCHPDLRAHD
ncbi:hypothetical protein PIB30_051178 [Stylosanthes scabra]|uniref:Uncharacterized protein n=1 Tax=Stylosanthes scabra TaxID=79078 RepID=A0ABU6VJT2_9FABA|nr:hypothetical protein [Stylosanthes scabra]